MKIIVNTLLAFSLISFLRVELVASPQFYSPEKRLVYYTCLGDIAGIDATLEKGVDIDARYKNYSALAYSILQDKYDVFEHLIKRGADIHGLTHLGNNCKLSVLSLATIYNRRKIVDKLLDEGADPNTATYSLYGKRYNAIAYAALYGHVDLLRLFAARGGDLEEPLRWPKWKDLPHEFPLLSVAAQNGDLDVVRYLVEERGHAVNPAGKISVLPPLSVAVRYDNLEVAKYLISMGADVNAVGHEYYSAKASTGRFKSNFLSPLGVAARYNRLDMVKLLFSHGAKLRENLKENQHPMYWADWGGYYRVIEEFEKHGYFFDKWPIISRHYRGGKEDASVSINSEFTPTFLRGHERRWTLDNAIDLDSPLRLAIVADENSEDLADILSAELSGRPKLELVERNELDAVLKEQGISRAGLTRGEELGRLSNLLGAEALILVESIRSKNEQVLQLKLVNSILGLQYGRNYIKRSASALVESIKQYADTVSILTNNFRRNYDTVIPISLVNVRSDLGDVDALKVENTLKHLLELELLGQSSVILTQRENLEVLIREKELGGREDAFKASALFIDVGLKIDPVSRKPTKYTLRIEPSKGKPYVLNVNAGDETLSDAAGMICSQLMSNIELRYLKPAFTENTALRKDAKTYFQEALWNFNLEQYSECLEPLRTAIRLGYNKRPVWDYYYRALSVVLGKLRKGKRGNDANNRQILALERERLIALEGILRLFRSDVSAKALKATRNKYNGEWYVSLFGFAKTFDHFRPVVMQRRYSTELTQLESQFLRLLNEYLIPSHTDPMPHGQLIDISESGIFIAIDLMSQLEESEYLRALEGLMDAYAGKEFSTSFKESSHRTRLLTPVVKSRWLSLCDKYAEHATTFNRSVSRLISEYRARSVYYDEKSLIIPISIRGRQQLVQAMQQAANSSDAKDDLLAIDMLRRPLLLEGTFGLGVRSNSSWVPEEGVIPSYFDNFDKEYTERVNELSNLVENYEKPQNSNNSSSKVNTPKGQPEPLSDDSTKDDKSSFGKLPVRLWSPDIFANIKSNKSWSLWNYPVLHEGKWLVLMSVTLEDTDLSNRSRVALLEINPKTLETNTRWIQGQLHKPEKVAKAGKWIAIASRYNPIQMLNIDTLDLKTLADYTPSISPQTGTIDVAGKGEHFFFFVQPEARNYVEQQGRKVSSMQILLRYDPKTDAVETVYNTRRNPPETLLDGTGDCYNNYLKDYNGFFVIYKHRAYYKVDLETLELSRTSIRKLYSLGLGFNAPNRLARNFKLDETSWATPLPKVRNEEFVMLPEDKLSLVLEYKGQGETKKRGRSAVVLVPDTEDVNYTRYSGLANFLEKSSREMVSKYKHYFGQMCGFVDLNTNHAGRVWAIFDMSDLSSALEMSTDL